MAEAFMIGELASRTARTVHAIRWYETQGLMPGVQRNGGGRRVYNEQHVDWLLLMERLRRTGMSIAEMRRYTALVMQGKATLSQRRDMLAAHRARVLGTIEEWSEALTLLDSKLDFYGEWLASGHRPKTAPNARAKTPAKAPVKTPVKARPAARRRRP
jgi:DNA-binding transcriptional MerR regulator